MDEILNRVRGLHGKIAADVVEKVGIGYLLCRTCDRQQTLTQAEVGRYLSSGWPKCCSYTMSWVTQNQIDRGEELPPTKEPSE